MRILITGDREWFDKLMISAVLRSVTMFKDPASVTVIEGEARGADRLGASAARGLGLNVEPYPAEWDQYGRAAGHIRNQQMLDTGVDLCLAFHDRLDESKGTADMVRRCLKAGIKVIHYSHGFDPVEL
jgi:hypothetical protein